MTFYDAVEELLIAGQPVRFSASGNSMHPTIKQGDTLIIEPCDPPNLSIGDIVLFKDNARLFAHRIVHMERRMDAGIGSAPFETISASRAKSPLLESCFEQHARKVQHSAKHKDLCFVLRGDFRSNPDPPILASQILGKVVAIERDHKIRSPYGYGRQLIARTYRISSQIKSFLSP